MGRGFQGAVLRVFGARDHKATVTGIESLAPHVVRVRMTAPTLFEKVEAAPTAWLRMWFPDPHGGSAEYQRAYTFSEADEQTGDFAVDFVVHEPAGPASSWATKARPGMALSVTSLGSSRFDLPDELPKGYLLIGDSASIPAINTVLHTVPADVPVELYLERHTDDDLTIPLVEHPSLRLHWTARDDETSLAEALEERDWWGWHAWAACESGSLRHVRKRLRDEFGFTKPRLHAQAYWNQGRAMGTTAPAQDA